MLKGTLIYCLIFLAFASCRKGDKEPTIDKHTQQSSTIAKISISPNEQLIATISNHKHDILLWQIETGKLHKRVLTSDTGTPKNIIFSNDNKYLVARCYKQYIIWDLEKFEIVRKVKSSIIPRELLSYDATTQQLVVRADFTKFQIINLASGTEQAMPEVTIPSECGFARTFVDKNQKKLFLMCKYSILTYSLPNLKKTQEVLLGSLKTFAIQPYESAISSDGKVAICSTNDTKNNKTYLQWVNLRQGSSGKCITLPVTVNENQYFNWVSFSGKGNNLLVGYQANDTHYVYKCSPKASVNKQPIVSFTDDVILPDVRLLAKTQSLVIFQKHKVRVIHLKTGKKVLVAGKSVYDWKEEEKNEIGKPGK